MDNTKDIILAIVKEQEGIIGPIAIEQANRVEGLKVESSQVEYNGDPRVILEKLVSVYQQVFGNVSVEVCKDAVHKVVGSGDRSNLPQLLR